MVSDDDEPPGYGGYIYYVEDEKRERVLHSRADAFHIVREHVPELHVWSDSLTPQVGFKFQTICVDALPSTCRAKDNHSAALALRAALIGGLASVDAEEEKHQKLRDRLVAEFAAANGLAFDPFDYIFRYAHNQAAMLFDERWPGTRFWIAARDARCYRESSKLYVNASTDLRIDTPSDVPVVKLSIWWEQFNWQTFAALFALLVHELVCHVPSPRVDCLDPNESVFAEGFADWAARKQFELWLPEMDVKLQAAAQHFGEEIMTVGLEENGGNPYWKQRFTGHAAANRAVSILREAAVDAPEERVRVLARDMTVHEADLQVKDDFVCSLGSITEEMKDRLVRWAKGDASIDELLSALD